MGAVTRRTRPGLSPAFCARTRRLPSLPRWPAGLLSRLPPWPLPPRLSPKLFISFDLRLVQEAFPDPASDVRAPSPLALRRPPHRLVFALTAGALGPTGGDSSAGPGVTCRDRRKGTRGRSIILSPGWFSVPPPPPPTSSLLPPSPAPLPAAELRPVPHPTAPSEASLRGERPGPPPPRPASSTQLLPLRHLHKSVRTDISLWERGLSRGPGLDALSFLLPVGESIMHQSLLIL